jgi:hypothetical protein
MERTTVHINGKDVTAGFDELAKIEAETDTAEEALVYLLKQNIHRASTCKQDEKFKMTFSLTFERCHGPTTIKSKCTYTKSMGEELVLFSKDTSQPLLPFEDEGDD